MNCLDIDAAHDWVEGFGMVDALIKIGVDSETGNQIVNATRDLEPKTRQAVIAAVNLLTDNRPIVDAAQRMTAYDTLCEKFPLLNDSRSRVKIFEMPENISQAENFAMVDALIKIGIDSETGNQILKRIRNMKLLNRQTDMNAEQAAKLEVYNIVDALLKHGVYKETILQSLNSASDREKNFAVAAVNVLSDSKPFIDAAQRMAAYDTLCNELSNLNTMRGGVKGFKGFVAEHMQAADYTAAGRFTRVVDDNGPVDLIFAGKNGRKYPYQVKIGYKPGRIDFAKYKGQTVIVDKGNPYLSEFQAEGARHGVKVVEGTVTEADVKRWADAMQFETSKTGGKTSVIVPESQRVINNLSAMHEAGLKVGKTGAMYGAGFSIGGNIIDMMRGKVTAGTAAFNVARDTAVSYGVGYTTGAVGSAVMRTAAGKAVTSALAPAAAALEGTAIGGAVLGATAAIEGAALTATAGAVGAVGSAGAAVGGALTAATAGTAVGTAVTAGVAGATAAGAAIGAAAIAAAPVVVPAAIVGAAFKIFGSIFDD